MGKIPCFFPVLQGNQVGVPEYPHHQNPLPHHLEAASYEAAFLFC